MSKSIAIGLCLLVAAGVNCFTLAGDLDPSGPPASTMVTLQQVYEKVCAPADLAQTGQTGCWNAAGNFVACAGTGLDGDYQVGVSVSPRFTDNGDGTVKDNLTGLIWLQDADCFAMVNWTTALSESNSLAHGSCGLTDSSVAGDWRLPNLRELQSLIDYSNYDSAPPTGHPFSGVWSEFYWSSTTYARFLDRAWVVNLGFGDVYNGANKVTNHYVWPVRGGR